MKTLKLIAVLFAVTVFAVGQENYQVTGTYTGFLNNSNCQNSNCFLPVPQYQGGSQAQLLAIATGQDDFVLGLGMGHDTWQLPLATTANGKSIWTPWAPGAGGTWEAIAVRNANEVYLFDYDANCNPAGTSRMYYWNGSTLDHSTGLCANGLTVTADDTVFGFWNTGGNDGFSYYATNAAATYPNWNWTRAPGDGWSKVAGLSRDTAFGIMNSTLYKLDLAANQYFAIPNTPNVQDFVITGDRWLLILDTSGVIHYMDITQPTWYQVQGTATKLYGSDGKAIFATDGNYYPYHMLMLALGGVVDTSGYYNCGPGNSGCPPDRAPFPYHTYSSDVDFPHSYGEGYSTSVTLPYNNAQRNVQATAISNQCNPVYGDPGSPECKPKISVGKVECAVMGSLLIKTVLGNPPNLNWVHAYSRVKTNGAPSCSHDITGSTPDDCEYNVTPYCSNTPNPALSPHVGITDQKGVVVMDMSENCMQVDGGPLVCNGTLEGKWRSDQDYKTDIGQAPNCTKLLGGQ